ncbi:uncharacterized protein MONBRDRAFT_14444 [Monosiga brevicollis MX1]|uniref:Phospholipid/glycerol acyltransferase domain-containing protein n=1 Tax=Monosiga brevicollis TaxID=81824 RepID=A9US00_MONBE|nr:uncharacterized protein MONBRDRAFT_14444 [Monosiga brevicollis MX1]EDQ92016.1 predicted protein [Monosiga brevicollis MX1]|eukprot:XP_001743302.1 hypothetical protein [Monosiga brevicollis MX1]
MYIKVEDTTAVRWFLTSLVSIFFREVETRNSHTVPVRGPVILVCAPHWSQFVDAVLVMSTNRRPIKFLTAAKTMRRRFVGAFSRYLGCIPVERPQDLATKGKGTISAATGATTVVGKDTQFTKDLTPGSGFAVDGHVFKVEKVISDTEAEVRDGPSEGFKDVAFKVYPRLNHDDLYEMVYDALKRGEAIGIFPEGGSHDGSMLLPFKAGVAQMALGAMAAGSPPVRLIPVGLTYFHGHRFRSRAMVEFGDPISIEQDMVEAYRNGGDAKRGAFDKLLKRVQEAVEAVTITAPDYETLKLLWAGRRLYKPENLELSTEQTQQLTIRFSEAYVQLKNEPEVQALRSDLAVYNDALRAAGLHDHEVVQTTVLQESEIFSGVLQKGFLVLIQTVVLIPFMVFGLPILFACRVVSTFKARAAAASSAVKEHGRDVVATWKVLTALMIVPICLVLYSILLGQLIHPRLTGISWCLLPIIMLGSLHLWDHYTDLVKQLRGLLALMISKQQTVELYYQRCKLKRRIRALVNRAADDMGIDRMFDEKDFMGEADHGLELDELLSM